MSETEEIPERPEPEAAKKGLPIKGVLGAAGGALAMGAAAGAAAFVLAPSGGNCVAPAKTDIQKPHAKIAPKEIAYVNIEPLVISLGPGARSKYLKISLSLETSKTHEKDLATLSPRIRDVLNTYLRAVDESDLERPAGMTRLRAQMLRRLQLVAPDGAVNDILITDFVLT